jgi:CheY-like chemotaxis protein
MSKKEFGEILLEADLISESQLAEALSLQRTYGERLASILVRKRILTEKFAVTYLGRQLGVPSVDFSKTEIDLTLLELVPLELCERHLVFPVCIEGTRLQLAMADPTDAVMVSQIEFEAGVRIAPMIGLESSIKNAILQARRSLRGGQKTLLANLQSNLSAPAGSGVETPPASEASSAVSAVSLPVTSSLNAREEAIFETLAGSHITTHVPARPDSVPTVEEIQTVLVADNREAVLTRIEETLRARRYRVLTARTGREVLNRVREAMPDLVILDGMLPEVHGFEICRQLKNSERFRHIPVILSSSVHTGWRFAADVKEKYGAEEYVEQPYDEPDLLRRVDLLLNRTPAGLPPDSEAKARQHLKDGVIALKQSRYEDAVAALDRGLAIDQFNDLMHYYMAMAYEKQDMIFHAIDHYEKAAQLNPDFYDAIISLANLYQRQGFRRKAAEMWELALAATKDEPVRARIKEHLLGLL